MLQRYIDDLKNSTGASLRMTSLIALTGFAGFIALGFACAAIFIAMQDHYDTIVACLTIAGIFLAVAGIIALICTRQQKAARARAAAAAARAAASAPLIDPAVIATGIQIARAVGLKKLVPVLVLASVAVGYMASRNAASAEGDDGAADRSADD